MPLWLAPSDKEVTVMKITGDDKVRKHLESLGIVQGSVLLVLSQESSGTIVKVHDSRLALDYEVCKTIMVE